METIRFRVESRYHNHSVRANKSIDITFKHPYTEMTNYIRTIQMLNENVDIGARVGSDKPLKLGSFMIKNIAIDNDGEGTIKVNSQIDFVNGDAINILASRSDEPLMLMFKCDVQSEDGEKDA